MTISINTKCATNCECNVKEFFKGINKFLNHLFSLISFNKTPVKTLQIISFL